MQIGETSSTTSIKHHQTSSNIIIHVQPPSEPSQSHTSSTRSSLPRPRGNYQVRSLAGAGGGKAYLEDGPKAARRLLGAKAVLEQLDVVLTAGAHGHDAADETGRVLFLEIL